MLLGGFKPSKIDLASLYYDEIGWVWENLSIFLVLMEEFELICLCLSCDYTATLWE